MATTIKLRDAGAPPDEDPIAQILSNISRPDAAPAIGVHAADAAAMTPGQIRWFRDRHGGKSPEEMRPQVSDSDRAREAEMTPMQIRTFRDAHNGMSPTELAAAGGVR